MAYAMPAVPIASVLGSVSGRRYLYRLPSAGPRFRCLCYLLRTLPHPLRVVNPCPAIRSVSVQVVLSVVRPSSLSVGYPIRSRLSTRVCVSVQLVLSWQQIPGAVLRLVCVCRVPKLGERYRYRSGVLPYQHTTTLPYHVTSGADHETQPTIPTLNRS